MINVQYRITAASGPSGYAMTVKAANTSSEIRGSPFVVKISAGPFVISFCYGHFAGGNPALPVGKLATFIIYQMDAFGNKLYTNSSGVHDFTVKVFTEDKKSVTLDIKITPSAANKDQMLVTFNITNLGKYSLEVGDTTGSIKGSPFGFSAVEGVVITADDCAAQFVPSQDLKVGVHLTIIITTKDDAGHTKKSGNILEFAVTSVPPMTGTPDPVAPLDMDNGTYVATIKITSAGFISFLITLFDEPIPGSPFEFEIEGGDALPRAVFDDVWTWMNYPLTFNVLSNDYVKSGSPIFIKIDDPENGAMVVGLDGTMIYTPDADFSGNEYLIYEIKDDSGEIAFGEVSITVTPPGQPYISAFPRSVSAFEDQPLPATGGMKSVEVACLQTDSILSAELFALNGRVYPAADISEPWQNVTVIVPNDVPEENVTMPEASENMFFQLKLSDEITRTNDDSNALRFSAKVEQLNAALKALQYMSLGDFNGNDTVYFTVLNSNGVGCTKSMSVYVRAVNDPPYVIGPSFFAINLSTTESFGSDLTGVGVPLAQLSVADPDADDPTGSATYVLAGTVEVESGAIQMTIPPSGYTTASYRVVGDKNWSSIPEHQIVVWGQGVRFVASLKDWNTALQAILFKSDNDSTQRVQLSLLFDDLGNFGCVGDCTSRESYSYVAQHQMAIMIYDKKYKPAYKLRAFVKFILYAMGGIAGLLAVFYLSGKSTRNCKRTRRTVHEFDEGEENFKMIRVYNPLWIPTYQKPDAATVLEPTGPGFEVFQNWKMEAMVPPEDVPHLGNERMASFATTWGADGNPQAPADHPQSRGRGRKFSVKWSQDQGIGGPDSATLGGLEGGFEEIQPSGGPDPPPPGAFPEAPAATEPFDPFANAFGGFGFEDSSSPPPPPPPGGTGGKKAFTGFGDEDEEEHGDDGNGNGNVPPPPPQSQQSSGARHTIHTAGIPGAGADPLQPPPPQANNDPFSISFNDEPAPPPPAMDNSFSVSFGDPPPPPPSSS
ncbi:protein MpGEX2 [Marchantia polymorpha subsp. ruderalis]